MPHSPQLDKERITTSTPESEAGVLVVRRHHLLVRCSHWLNVPILLGLILSGLSIYCDVCKRIDIPGQWIWFVLIDRRCPVYGYARMCVD